MTLHSTSTLRTRGPDIRLTAGLMKIYKSAQTCAEANLFCFLPFLAILYLRIDTKG